MDNNSGFTTSDAVLTAAMSGGLGGRGGGYGGGGGQWGGGYGGGGGHHTYADSGSIMHGVIANRQFGENSDDCTRSLMDAGLNAINQNFEGQVRSGQFNELSREHTDLERRVNDQNAALIGTMNDFRFEAKDCCCETQKLVTAEATRTRELLLTTELQNAKDANNITATVSGINAAAAANTAAIIAAIQSINGGHGGH